MRSWRTTGRGGYGAVLASPRVVAPDKAPYVESGRETPRLTKLLADSAYQGVVKWLATHWAAVSLEIVKRRPEQVGFEVQPKRWIVERTFGWLNYWRRLSKDYEYLPRSSESMIYTN